MDGQVLETLCFVVVVFTKNALEHVYLVGLEGVEGKVVTFHQPHSSA